MRTVSHEAVQRLEKAVRRSKRRSSIQLPREFARDVVSEEHNPPLARLFRGGGEVRLKVYLTVVMMATAAPHDTKVTGRELAALLDLPDPEGAGGRRASKALADLAKMGLIRREERPGRVPVTTVLDPKGTGEEWTAESLSAPWITLPIALFRNGWLIALSGRELALLVVLKELTHGRKGEAGAWVDGIRKRQYGLSDDTWTRASGALVEAGLLDVDTDVFSSYGEPRKRNRYRLRLESLALKPGALEQSGPDLSK